VNANLAPSFSATLTAQSVVVGKTVTFVLPS